MDRLQCAVVALLLACFAPRVHAGDVVAYGYEASHYQTMVCDPQAVAAMVEPIAGKDQARNAATNSELLAWAVSTSLGVPPRIYEDAVLLVRLPDRGAGSEWVAVAVTRIVSLAGTTFAQWSVDDSIAWSGQKRFRSEPNEEDLSGFLKRSNFGYNRVWANIKVLQVVLFRESAVLKAVLAAGISDDEKWRRRDRMTE
jgi:hypothetical protein